jgi:hypothetical protein
MSYSTAAIKAARMVNETKISPIEAWKKAVLKVFYHSKSSQQKRCPQNTFLGLCEEGVIKGMSAGKYTRSDLNKKYGITAIKILARSKSNEFTPINLWKEVLKELNADLQKKHNSQMNVVLALWDEGLIDI